MSQRVHIAASSYEALMWDVITNVHNYVPKPGDRVLDIGAHFGMFSLYCATRGGSVVAYEPTPLSFEELEHSSRVAKEIKMGSIEPIRAAIWSYDGEVPWKTNSEIAETNRIDPNGLDKVQCVSLRTALRDQDWDCVKIDVEGGEYVILTTGIEQLSRIKFLTVEIHNDILSREQCIEIHELLEKSFPVVKRLPVIVSGQATEKDSALYCWR